MIMTNYVMKLNLFKEMKMGLLIVFTQGLCGIIIYFMMMIDLQKNVSIK
jgi:chemotaxis protein CheY-P-specific phosphatase CheC